jgi:hypothetical protein
MKIFVSYRREDTGPFVARLCGRLDEAFGARNVFFDERSIGTGADFRGSTVGAIVTSEVVLAVIGAGWASTTDERGRPRLHDQDDPVRLELAMAMPRNLIPLLVDNTPMPTARQLPDVLRDLPGRSGLRIYSDARFDAGVDDLIQRLGGPVAAANAHLGSRAPRATASWMSFEGHWQTRDGGWAEIVQDGNQVEMSGYASNGGTYSARGQIQGDLALLDFSNSFGLRGRIAMRLINNGAYIQGQVQSAMGVTPFDMMRRT